MTAQQELTAVLIGIVATLAGGVIWAVRLEGRVNLSWRLLEDHLRDSANTFRDMTAHMDRIERKLDNMALNCVAMNHARPPKAPFGPPFHRRADDEPED